MLVPWRALNGRYLVTAQCAKGAERKLQRMEEEKMREIAERDFQAYERPLETVISFKYLGQVLMAVDSYWPEVVGNLNNEQKSWALMMRILGWEGAYPRVSGLFSRRWYRQCCFFVRIRGCLPSAWDGPWEVFNAGSHGG